MSDLLKSLGITVLSVLWLGLLMVCFQKVSKLITHFFKVKGFKVEVASVVSVFFIVNLVFYIIYKWVAI